MSNPFHLHYFLFPHVEEVNLCSHHFAQRGYKKKFPKLMAVPGVCTDTEEVRTSTEIKLAMIKFSALLI